MTHFATTILTPWSNFYVMTGSAAASLTGLMFVVITLVSGERTRRNPDGVSTFSTPTVVHFCGALLFSAILIAPWRSLAPPAALLGLAGLAGVAYVYRIMHRTRTLSTYKADVEDWTWYTGLPFVAYAAVVTGGILLFRSPGNAPFAVATGVVLLLFIGIHNAWDIVTFLATDAGPNQTPPPA